MSLYGALSIGVAGLDANSTALSAASSNIANVNTVGYKGAGVTFSDALTQITRGASGPTAALGGTNPIQVGLGDGIRTEVVSGLDGHEAVVKAHAASLTEAQPVEVVDPPNPSPSSARP